MTEMHGVWFRTVSYTHLDVYKRQGDRYVCCATAAGPAFEGAQIEQGMPASKGAVDKVWLEGRRIKYSVIGNDRPVGLCGSCLLYTSRCV